MRVLFLRVARVGRAYGITGGLTSCGIVGVQGRRRREAGYVGTPTSSKAAVAD